MSPNCIGFASECPRADGKPLRNPQRRIYAILTRTREMSGLAMLTTQTLHADPLTIVTWNTARQQDTSDIRSFVQDADVLVLQEITTTKATQRLAASAGLSAWHIAVSDFVADNHSKESNRLEVAILSRHAMVDIHEFDPIPSDDGADAPVDTKLKVPEWVPSSQRRTVGSRGYLWADIPDLQLSVAAVHLKSSLRQVGKRDQDNSFKREAVIAAVAQHVLAHSKAKPEWSYIVAGDFNVAPTDAEKVGIDLHYRCPTKGDCTRYDQTHAILSAGLLNGLIMRNLTIGLGRSYDDDSLPPSPIDVIYATGQLFDETSRLIAQRGPLFGSDHFAIRVSVE